MVHNLIEFARLKAYERKSFAIMVPTANYRGNGSRYLQDLLESILLQTSNDFIVIVIDHSKNNSIKDLVKSFDAQNFFYFKNIFHRGSWTFNSSAGIWLCGHSNVDYVKIMFQDDIFFAPNSLDIISKAFSSNPGHNWLCSSSAHFYDTGNSLQLLNNEFGVISTTGLVVTPQFNERLLYAENYISCPSAVALRNGLGVYFDKKLVLGGDCEFYWNLGARYGEPIIVREVLTCNRESRESLTTALYEGTVKSTKRFRSGRKVRTRKDLHVWELNYMQRKHGARDASIQIGETFFENLQISFKQVLRRFLDYWKK